MIKCFVMHAIECNFGTLFLLGYRTPENIVFYMYLFLNVDQFPTINVKDTPYRYCTLYIRHPMTIIGFCGVSNMWSAATYLCLQTLTNKFQSRSSSVALFLECHPCSTT